jgi:hypothetical protein
MTTTRFLALVVAVGGALVVAASAAAGPVHHGTGTSTQTSSTTLSVTVTAGTTIIEQLNTRADVGVFTGTVTEHLELIVNNNTGVTTLDGVAELNGTYQGCGSRVVTQSILLTGLVTPAGEIRASFATTDGAAVPVHGTVVGTTASPTAVFEDTYFC